MASEPEAGPSRPARQASIHSLLSLRPHSSLSTSLITSTAPRGLLTSSALNENDLSVRPVGVDLVQEDEEGLRRGVLEGLDAVKGLVLCIQALDAASTYIANWQLPDETWQGRITFPLRSSIYLVRLATHVCVPALHVFLGVGCVLTIASKKSLGWNSSRLLRRAFARGLALMVLNELLMVQYIMRSRGRAFFILLPLWSLGFNLFVTSCVLLFLGGLERLALFLLLRFSGSPSDATERDGTEDEVRDLVLPPKSDSLAEPQPTERTPLAAFFSSRKSWPPLSSPHVPRLLLITHHFSSLILFVLIAGLLAVNLWTLPIDEDWSAGLVDVEVWRGRTSRRSWVYWFFVAPTPTTWLRPYKGLVSQYAPLGWLPFSLLGALYARFLVRRRRSRAAIASTTFALGLALFFLFILTRLIPFGNLTTGRMASSSSPFSEQLHTQARTSRGFYFSTWQTFFYSTKFPPDLAFFALWSSATAGLTALALTVPGWVWERSPLLQFGRAPMFFLAIQTLGFHYLIPGVLALLDWPRYLDLGWTLIVWLASLPVGWILCEAWVVWKDSLGPDKIWRIF